MNQFSVNYLGEKFNSKYPYEYRIELADNAFDSLIISNRQKTVDVKFVDWLKENEIQCTIAGSGLYLKNDGDVALFLLRWA